MSYCPNCKRDLHAQAPWCPSCGGQLQRKDAAAPGQAQQQPAQGQSPPQQAQYQQYQQYPQAQPGYDQYGQYSQYPGQDSQPEFIEPSKNMIMTTLFGILSGMLMIIGVMFAWIIVPAQSSLGVSSEIKISSMTDYAYLYLVVLLGVMVLVFSLLLPMAQHALPNPRLFAFFILMFSIFTIILAAAGLQHMSANASSAGGTPTLGPGGIASLMGGIFGIPTGFLFMRLLPKKAPLFSGLGLKKKKQR